MRIKHINYLKDFGSFKNFKWDFTQMNDFERVNLIYGYNGMGKTMLSRFFYSLSIGKNIIEDSINFKENFSCETSEGKITQFDNNITKGKINVFNQDFINTELKFDENKAKKIVYYEIGKEKIKLKEKLNKYIKFKNIVEKYKDSKQNELIETDKEKTNIVEQFQDNVINCLEIRKQQFKYDVAEKYLNEILAKDIKKLNDTELNDTTTKYLQREKKEVSNDVVLTNLFPSLEQLDNISRLLSEEIKRPSTTDLKDEILNWLEEGVEFQKDTEGKCLFCGRDFDLDYWGKRKQEILTIITKDESFIKKEEEINKCIRLLNDLLVNKISTNIRAEDLYSQFQESFTNLFNQLNECHTKSVVYVEKVHEAMSRKLQNPSISIQIDNEDFYLNLRTIINNVIDIVKDLENLYAKQNSYTDNIKSIKEDSENKIKLHFASLFWDSYTKEIDKGRELSTLISKANGTLSKINNYISSIQQDIANQKAPILEIEKYLNLITGRKDHLKIRYNDSTQEYFLERLENGDYKPAKLLSEGEKNILAFSYFLALIKETKEKEIIVIDDPVSSLDQNHFFNILHLIFNVFFNQGKKINQIFILTHNFLFFRKIRKMIKGKPIYETNPDNSTKKDENGKFIGKKDKNTGKNNLEDKQIYLIEKDATSSRINPPSDLFLKYNTEYCVLIDQIKDFHQKHIEGNYNYERGVLIINAMRRVTEYILSFKFPGGNITDSFTKSLQGQHPEWTYLLSILNLESHAEGMIDSLDYSNYAQMKQFLEDFKSYIKFLDPEHYKNFFEIKTS